MGGEKNNKVLGNQKMKNIKRRNFLKSTLLSGMAAAFVPVKALAVDRGDVIEEKDKNLVFLFQGDSITDGNRGRNTDPNHIMGHGYAFAVASRVGADFPDAGFTFYNRGISGNRVPDLEKRWQTDTLDLKPDVLSILIGINDASIVIKKEPGALTVEDFETGYRNILKQSRAANPDLLLVLGIPFVYEIAKVKDNWAAWKKETADRAGVVRRLATEFNAIVVEYPMVIDKAMTRATPDYWIWDGIHPTVFTHELMAREWIKQVATRLKFLRKYKY